MRRRIMLITTLAAMLAAVGALLAACGDSGGDSLTLEEYFTRFEAIDQTADQEIGMLYADFPTVSDEELFSDEENLPLIKNLLQGFPEVLEDAVDEVDQLDPPSEVEEAHNDLIAAGRDLVMAHKSAASEIADVETIGEAEGLVMTVDGELTAGQERFDAACRALVAVGTDNGLTVNVSCDD